MKIVYELGPERIWIGDLEFQMGVPKDAPDEIAESALREPTIRFKKVEREGKRIEGRSNRERRSAFPTAYCILSFKKRR